MEPWYKVIQPRPEVSAGRSFNPHEFVIALEQVVAGTAPREDMVLVLRRLKAEQDRGPDFLRLANALSGLYPRDSDEKRLLDAMLLAVPR
jgi:hypothetical protein